LVNSERPVLGVLPKPLIIRDLPLGHKTAIEFIVSFRRNVGGYSNKTYTSSHRLKVEKDSCNRENDRITRQILLKKDKSGSGGIGIAHGHGLGLDRGWSKLQLYRYT
jgi:hypothetical protein